MDIAVLALGAALALIIVAGWLYFNTQLEREQLGLPRGEVLYADGDDVFEPDPLYAHDIGLVGKPDYLVRGADGLIVPVELKSSVAPLEPYGSHVMQLAAYCLLVEENYGIRPKYGLIQYRDKAFQIDYDEALEADLIDVVTAMRADLYSAEVPRSHDNPRLCAACSVSDFCDQSIRPQQKSTYPR